MAEARIRIPLTRREWRRVLGALVLAQEQPLTENLRRQLAELENRIRTKLGGRVEGEPVEASEE
jgi:hypothetical protein